MLIRTLACAAAAVCVASGVAQDFAKPVRLMADGKPIKTDVGHSAPYVYDFDRDGVRDLLVGQFGEGKLRIYKNAGSDAKPMYQAVSWFKAGGAIATVPAS